MMILKIITHLFVGSNKNLIKNKNLVGFTLLVRALHFRHESEDQNLIKKCILAI